MSTPEQPGGTPVPPPPSGTPGYTTPSGPPQGTSGGAPAYGTSGATAYGTPSYGAPAYGQPGFGAGAPKTSGMAIAALVVGILSLLIAWFPVIGVVGIIGGIVAVVLGVLANKKIRAGVASGKGLALGGIITGALSILIGLVVSVVFGLLINAAVDEAERQGVDLTELAEQIEESAAPVESEEPAAEEAPAEEPTDEAAAGDPSLWVDYADITCDDLIAETIAASETSGEPYSVTAVNGTTITEDNRSTYTMPGGTDEALVLSCTGTADWSDGDVTGLLMEFTVDATGAPLIGYYPQP